MNWYLITGLVIVACLVAVGLLAMILDTQHAAPGSPLDEEMRMFQPNEIQGKR